MEEKKKLNQIVQQTINAYLLKALPQIPILKN